jgi:hypothetical protein
MDNLCRMLIKMRGGSQKTVFKAWSILPAARAKMPAFNHWLIYLDIVRENYE